MAQILLIEDSQDVVDLICLRMAPHAVQHAPSLAAARSALAGQSYDLVLIDVNLPDGDGFGLCLDLSQDDRYKDIPRVLLTAKNQIPEKLYGFNCGADDYVTKPFNPLELRARVDRFLQVRRTVNSKVTRGCLQFDLEFQKCMLSENGQSSNLELTPTEFRLLINLAQNEGKVLSRQALEKLIWQAHGATIETRGIDTHIAHLRKKLGSHKASIVSVYGKGYSFKTPGLKAV